MAPKAKDRLTRLECELRAIREQLDALNAHGANPWLDRKAVALRLGLHITNLDRLRRSDPDFPQPSYPLQSPRWRMAEIDAYMEGRRGRQVS